MKVGRRRFLALGAATVAVSGLGYSRFIEPNWLDVRRLCVPLGLGVSKPIRILHLSDLHWSGAVAPSAIGSAIEQGLRLEPDLTCLTGDLVTVGDERAWDDYLPLLERLSAAGPCFACLGNHDGGAWSGPRGGLATTAPVVDLLESAGIRVLENSSVAGPGGLSIVGLSDLWGGSFHPGAAFLGVEDPSQRNVVVLAHNPDTKDAIRHFSWQLMLSGHTHGGQIVVPLLGPPYAPVRDRRYLAGLKPWGERQIHVSRGVGNLYGFRFNCRPEVAVLEIL